MKINKMKWSFFVSIILMVAIACQDQTDVYEEFVVPGGHVYPGVLGNPKVLSGNNNIQIIGTKPMGTNVNEIRVFWNYFTDSLSFMIDENTSDNLVLNITGLEEQSYLFTLHSYNTSGDVSVPLELFGKCYGDRYKASLNNRRINTLLYTNTLKTVDITFDLAYEGTLFSQITYTNHDKDTVSVKIPTDQVALSIDDYDTQGVIQYSTVYKPDSTCIDVFYCETDTFYAVTDTATGRVKMVY